MKKKLSYKKSGVDIEKANQLIAGMSKFIDTTRIKGSMDSIGGFGGFFNPSVFKIKDPRLVASTDGVGTKLKIAQLTGKHNTVGIDLVAMCVNDVICSGARPMFFLDYFAAGKLESRIWNQVVRGIIKGCKESGCALLGGETAEMPGMYEKGDYDLAGFSVAIVERKKIIDGKKIRAGNVILGLASSGLHSNGYSFVRGIFNSKELKEYKDLLLKPTRLYVKPVLDLLNRIQIKGIANITGGGFYDNIPRILPSGMKAVINKGTWVMPGIYEIIKKKKADISEKELYRTFNMGIGMVLVLPEKEAVTAKEFLWKKHRLKSYLIGAIEKGKKQVTLV
jgi:phosphoribosylformylglycinamidine cyclo-ligase